MNRIEQPGAGLMTLPEYLRLRLEPLQRDRRR